MLIALIIIVSVLYLILSFGGTLRPLSLNWPLVLAIELDVILLCELVRLVARRGEWMYVESERARIVAVGVPRITGVGIGVVFYGSWLWVTDLVFSG
jgi:hypothetical protein